MVVGYVKNRLVNKRLDAINADMWFVKDVKVRDVKFVNSKINGYHWRVIQVLSLPVTMWK